MSIKADINWALKIAEGLWFTVQNSDRDEFLTVLSKYLRKVRTDALGRAKGRIKVSIHKEAQHLRLSDAQREKLFKTIDGVK